MLATRTQNHTCDLDDEIGAVKARWTPEERARRQRIAERKLRRLLSLLPGEVAARRCAVGGGLLETKLSRSWLSPRR